MKYRILKILSYCFLFLIFSCGFYSFKGSIPAHIKSIYIAPIENNSIESTVSELMKIQLDQSMIDENILKLLPIDEADSQLNIKISSFTDKPYSYDIELLDSLGYERVNEKRITVNVQVSWIDLKDNSILFEGNISSWGAYDPDQDISTDNIDNDNDTYIDGDDDDEFGLPRESAIKIAARKISESIISNIISTW